MYSVYIGIKFSVSSKATDLNKRSKILIYLIYGNVILCRYSEMNAVIPYRKKIISSFPTGNIISAWKAFSLSKGIWRLSPWFA